MASSGAASEATTPREGPGGERVGETRVVVAIMGNGEDSDETIVEDSLLESDWEEDELYRNRTGPTQYIKKLSFDLSLHSIQNILFSFKSSTRRKLRRNVAKQEGTIELGEKLLQKVKGTSGIAVAAGLCLFGNDMTEEKAGKEIKNINGGILSPEIQFICKQSSNLQTIRQTRPINLLHQVINEMEESQSLLQAEGNCPVFAGDICQIDIPQATTVHGEYNHFIGMDLELAGFLETEDRNAVNYDDEDSPEISLLSNVNAPKLSSKDSVQKDTEAEGVFESARMTSNDKDMTGDTPLIETVILGITGNRMAESFEDKNAMELLSDSETFQMLEMLENQEDAFSVDGFADKENNIVPEELFSALNSMEMSTSSHPVEKVFGHSMSEEELPTDKRESDYPYVNQIELKPQFHLQDLEEIKGLITVKMPCSSKEQVKEDGMSLSVISNTDHEQDRSTGKGSGLLKNTTSCETPVQVTAHMSKKFTRKRNKFTVNAPSNCQQLPEGMNKQIDSCEAKARMSAEEFESDTKDKTDECLQLEARLCCSSSSNMNTKIEQLRKSQRIAKKRKQTHSKKYSSDTSCNYISLSSINRRDKFGQTLLHIAAMEDDLNGLCAMIKAGASVNTQDYAGWTPLHETSAAGCFETTNELLKAGADVNCKSHEQVTPLHDAVKGDHYKVAELLLWYGADPLLKTESGKSAFDEATTKQMRKLLQGYIDRSTIREVSAERLIEKPVSDQGRNNKKQRCPKVKPRSSERIQYSCANNARARKQYRGTLGGKQRKRNSQKLFASQTQNSCRILNAATLKDSCPVESVGERATSHLGTSCDSTKLKDRTSETHHDFGHAAIISFTKETTGSLVYQQHNSDRVDEVTKEPRILTGSETQQESDSGKRNYDGSSERKEAYQSTEPAGPSKGQVTKSCATLLNPIQEESASPLTNLANESNLQKELCAMKHSTELPCHKDDILDDNLHSSEKMYVWSVTEEGIDPANEKNRSQYLHSENSLDKFYLNVQRHIGIEHELKVLKDLSFVAKYPICLKDKLLEPKTSNMLPEQGTTHLNYSNCTVISEQYNLNADQNADKNTSKAVETFNEQTDQVNMEVCPPYEFSQDINRTSVSEYSDTCDANELTLSVNESTLAGPETEQDITDCLEKSKNGTEVTSQMLDKEPFQGDVLQPEIAEECYEANGKENVDNRFNVSSQSNELENVQSKGIQTEFHENGQGTHCFSSRSEKNISPNDSQFSQTGEQQKTDLLVSFHPGKKEGENSSQLLYMTRERINKRNTKGETHLHLAAKKGDLSLVKSLITSGACVNQKDNAGWTAIHEASNRGFTEIIAELLKAGADVNSKSLDSVLPIHDAVSGNHFEPDWLQKLHKNMLQAVRLLLLHGANPNETDNCGGNALDEATCEKMKDLLKSYGATETEKIPRTSNVGEKKSLPPRSRKIRSCYDCGDHLIFPSKSAGGKRGTHESINEVLQDIEEKQDRLLFFELRSQRDADLYIEKLSHIQNILNDLLANQKSERDEVAKKYRASVESFKHGALRAQLVQLASRQKSLLLLAQKQKKLSQKIQNYKNTRKDCSDSTKDIPNILSSGENTKDGTSDGILPYSDMESSFIEQESRQHSNRSRDINGETIGQKEISENKLRKYSTEEVTNKKPSEVIEQTGLPSEPDICIIRQSYVKEMNYITQGDKSPNVTSRMCAPYNSKAGSTEVNSNLNQPTNNMNEALPMQLQLKSTHNDNALQKTTLPSSRISQDANLKATGIFPHAESKSRISQSNSQCSDSQYCEKQLNFKANRRKKIQLINLLEQGKLKPGDNVLEFILQNSKHKASLLGNGKVKTDTSVYQNPVQWIKALLGNDISISWKYAWNKVTYCGTVLSQIIDENIPKETEVIQQQNKLYGGNSIECDTDHSPGEKSCCSGHQTMSFHDTENILQEVQIPLFTETQPEETLSAAMEIDPSYQPTFSKTSKRFLQFNKIVLIKDEEFLPCHIMEQYWNFYVHCENFGF